MTVGASSIAASNRSFSRKRVRPAGRDVPGCGSATSIPAAPPEPPAICFFTGCSPSRPVALV